MNYFRLIALLLCLCATLAQADPDIRDVAYTQSTLDNYSKHMCLLDVYLPHSRKGRFPLLVWFHGGLLTTGDKSEAATAARIMANAGIGVIVANYRLSPTVKYPTYLQDSADAVAWAKANASRLGADPSNLFIGGYSAGGYLATMLVMDPEFLHKDGIEPQTLRGLISISGIMVTPVAVRAERGLGPNSIIADQAAPLYYVHPDTPPIFLLAGDNDKLGRREENELFAASLKAAGDKDLQFQTFTNRNHVTMFSLVFTQGDLEGSDILQFVRKHQL